MTGSGMAEQLERVAEGARNGNSACIKVAREMLAHRRMLEALDAVGAYWDSGGGKRGMTGRECDLHDLVNAARAAADKAATKGEPNGR